MEKYVVFNPTNNVVSFQLKPSYSDEDLADLAKHKVRKLVRGNITPIAVQPHTSVDLVALSGMSVETIRGNSELHLLVRRGALQIMETTIVENIPVEETQEEVVEDPKEAEIVEEEVKEEVQLPEIPKEVVNEEVKPVLPSVPPLPQMPSIPAKKGAKKKTS